ncbi:vitamin D(3) 25-hydroxylase-like isoform X2 [Salvelinus namaycush]|uniref:Vitamin D(3) 25-hydroxylase-like isoform X2 n=1 Tax=Salvelinus namaycush TaxID=8040 RepID=A0A8U0U0R9_SALNM|nr:vitamin D(3) 25-hydroxylase-like isoform X2 [Salvelinus namaycush]
MLGSVVLLWLFILLLFFFIRVRRPKNFPPGPRPLPILGNLLQLDPVNPLKNLEGLKRRYGNVFSLYIGSRPAVVLNGLEVVREALVTRAAEYAGRPTHMMVSHLFKGKGIVMANYGSSWRDHRRFALTTLRNFGLGKRSMEERILEEVSHICTELESSAGGSMDPQHLFHLAASNIICSLIFGERFEYDDPVILTLIQRLEEFTKEAIGPWAMLYEIMPVLRPLPLPFRNVFHKFDQMKEHIKKVVTKHKSSRVAGEPRDLLDCYLDQIDKTADGGSTFNDTQMVSLLLDLFIAGTDTTSNTLRSAMLYLMTNQHVQDRCHREIAEVLEGRADASFEDRHAMPYVQATIHEAQRMSDTVPLSVFHTTCSNTQIHSYQLPQGTTVIPNLSSVLHEEGQWKFPHEFNPENFLNEVGEFVKPEAFLPFSAGSRVCLGEGLARMELFLVLVTLLRRYRFVWPEDGGVPDFSLIFGGTQSPKPYRLGVRLRSSEELPTVSTREP